MILRRWGSQRAFAAAVMTLATGTAVASAIPIAISPVLTRIYTPEDWGMFSLFLTVTATLGAIASGRYELAIMLPEEDEDARALAMVGMLISVVLGVLLLVPALVFAEPVARLLGEADLAPWLILASPTVLFMGVFNCLNYLTTRNAAYRTVAEANVSKATVGAVVQVGLGLLAPGPGGLITGYTASSAAANLWLARRLRRTGRLTASRKRLVSVARRFSDFPKYSVGSALAQALNLALISVLVSRIYSIEALGEFALVQRVLGLPLMLIAGSVGQVYFQRASAELRDRGDFLDTFMVTFRGLAAIALTTTFVMYLLLPPVFSTVFGAQWGGAGELARYLLPGFAMQFIVSPLSLSNQLNMRNRFGLVGNLVALAVMCGTLSVAATSGATVEQALLAMSIAQACYYGVFGYLIFVHVAAGRRTVMNP